MNLGHAIRLATDRHDGQVDKLGQPYILHPIVVMQAVLPLGEEFAVVAILHDVLEDTGKLEIEDADLLTSEEIEGLNAITRRSTERYDDYIRRVKENDIARAVKVADLHHNLSIERQQYLPPETREFLTQRYYAALEILNA